MTFAKKTHSIIEEGKNERVSKNIINYIRNSYSFNYIKSNNYCNILKNGGVYL